MHEHDYIDNVLNQEYTKGNDSVNTNEASLHANGPSLASS